MSILVAVALLSGIAGFGYLWTRDPLFPPVLMSALWAFTLACAWPVAVSKQYVFDPLTLWIIVIGAVCFFCRIVSLPQVRPLLVVSFVSLLLTPSAAFRPLSGPQ